MKEIQIPNGYFHLWKTYVTHQGIDAISLAESHGFKTELLEILSAPIAQQSSYHLFEQCIQWTQKALGQTHICFDMAKYIKAEHFGVVGYMATRSQRISESLDYIIRFSRLVIDGEEITPMQLSHHGNALVLSWPFIAEHYILINELNSAFIIEMAHQIVALNQFPLRKISFAHPPQMPIYHYQKFYGCEVVFNHARYEFEISLGSLDVELDQADPSLMEFLLKQAEDAIASKIHLNTESDSVKRQLQIYIAEYLANKQQAPKIEEIAQVLHISVRTLQRQLKLEHTTFKKILDEERMQLCEKLLSKDRSLIEIANQLGYSDQSALARAYKACRGKTLLQFKNESKV